MRKGKESGKERRRERNYLCIQEHCAVVSPANKETKKLANVGNRCHSCQWRKKTNVPRGGEKGERRKRKTRRESAPDGNSDHSAGTQA